MYKPCIKNYYIYNALLLLCDDNYSSMACFRTLHNLIYYIFNNISEHKRNELVRGWMDTLQKQTVDEHYYKITFEWIKSITQKDHVGFSSYASKAELISKVVKPYYKGNGY